MTNRIIYKGTLWLFGSWCFTEIRNYEQIPNIYQNLYDGYYHIIQTDGIMYDTNGKTYIDVYKYDVVANEKD